MKYTVEREQQAAVAHVRVLLLADGDTILASRIKGERLRAAIEAAAGVTPLVVLDFQGAEAVTPSFFLGGPWGLWEREHVEQCPIIANLPIGAYDDLELIARVKRNPLWLGAFLDGVYSEAKLAGDVEGTDRLALLRIFEQGSATASDMRDFDPILSITGWNNRLAGLWQRKVLGRRKLGRMFQYFVPWEGRAR